MLKTARTAWHAYRSTSPEPCFALLSTNLNRLPLLKPVLRDLLEELPSVSTGLGATEMRMLELIGRGYERTNTLFHNSTLRQTRIFNEWEHGYLLDGLAFGPMPAVAGLDDELRTISRKHLGAPSPLS
jgi:phytoene dehydrogenase-like protein